ncbi:isocitrate lyase/PEP mutase family protein [Sphingomonas sp. ERG5]|uniref:isocitrate lyase/PEP mutase family protein n=1 Tax=Sphingomonas sp. ERG5 TaxID=1381597 RepID=UPI00054BD1F9|nr:isocitrate lyase/PEP mutase family protein [Sphingomonas sp. ERG5]
MTSMRAKLREGLAGGRLMRAPGVFDTLSGVLAEQAGFEAVFLSGSALAWSHLARPDIGLLSASEVATILMRLSDRIGIPVLVDADSGFGNAIQVTRTVRQFEAAGAAGIQIEDQAEIKSPGAPTDRPLVPLEAMVGKLKAALDARRHDDTLISARTDAVSSVGFDEALRRAAAYIDAGADLIFVESLSEPAEIQRLVRELGGARPLVHNIMEGGVSPLTSATAAGEAGFSLILFPGAVIQATARAGQDALRALAAAERPSRPVFDRDALNAAIDGPAFLAAAARYAD